MPIWYWSGGLIASALFYIFLKKIYKKHILSSYATAGNLNSDLGIPQVSSSTYLIEEDKQQNEQVDKSESKNKNRMKSIDVFRGFCLCIMIFVNYGAGGYSFLVRKNSKNSFFK